jgi:hypothetical protein
VLDRDTGPALWVRFQQAPPRSESIDFFYALGTYYVYDLCHTFDFWWLQKEVSSWTALFLFSFVPLLGFSLYRLGAEWKSLGAVPKKKKKKR